MDFPNSKPIPDSVPTVPGTGYLIVQVTTARGAIPLPDATVEVYSDAPDEKPEISGDLVASLSSGRDGNTPPLPLNAPPRATSERPGNALPYALYRVVVSTPGFFEAVYENVPVFDGITAIQPAVLIPLPEGSAGNLYPQDATLSYDENTASDL